MSTSNIIWIVIAALVAVLLIAALIIAVRRATHRSLMRQAEEIRERAKLEKTRVERRQAVADETAAKARAAQAEAEAKAAEAARLQERAAMHQSEAATSRERLQEQWQRADSIDPEVTRETGNASDRVAQPHDEPRGEQHQPTTDARAVRPALSWTRITTLTPIEQRPPESRRTGNPMARPLNGPSGVPGWPVSAHISKSRRRQTSGRHGAEPDCLTFPQPGGGPHLARLCAAHRRRA